MSRMQAISYLFLFISFASCSVLGSDEEKPDLLKPGSRNYTWKVDSVYSAPGGWMNTIWGSSPNDMWIGSSGGSDRLWHYDGTKWEPSTQRIPRSIYSIFGFAQNDVWMGTNGIIYHFDGSDWTPFYTYSPEGMGEPTIYDIWGTSASNIYAVGSVSEGQGGAYKGFVLHHNGSEWKEILLTDFDVYLLRTRDAEKNVFMEAIKLPNGSIQEEEMIVYEYKNQNLRKVVSKTVSESETFSMNTINNELLIIFENKISKYSNGKIKEISVLTNNSRPFGIYGRHEKDLFLVTKEGVEHFNGEDTRVLFELDNERADVFRGIIMEKDIFFVVNDYEAGTNLIYKGKLEDQN